jgi:hypothetical protein
MFLTITRDRRRDARLGAWHRVFLSAWSREIELAAFIHHYIPLGVFRRCRGGAPGDRSRSTPALMPHRE